jgi:hypothetical protein
VLLAGSQVILKSAGSTDVTAGLDLRLKAGQNLQAVAVDGGVLVEGKGTTLVQDYHDLIGEDVVASGVVLRATGGTCAVLGAEVYVRTGGPLGEGAITLDASAGTQPVRLVGGQLDVYAQTDINFWVGGFGTSSGAITTGHHFGAGDVLLGAPLTVTGGIVACGDGATLIVDGDLNAGGSLICVGGLSSQGGTVGETPPDVRTLLRQGTAAALQASQLFVAAGQDNHALTLVEDLYAAGRPGDPNLLAEQGFSYRDADDEGQYRTAGFVFPETRWQQMLRLGQAQGGAPWREKPVDYQGRRLYPFPGHRKWVEEAAMWTSDFTMFEAAAGVAADRPGSYEEPVLAGWQEVVMASGYVLTT